MKLRGTGRLARVLVVLVAALAVSESAQAAVISSHVTTPSDPTYIQLNLGNVNLLVAGEETTTVKGTTVDDGTAGNVDLVCYGTNGTTPLVSDVPVSYTGDDGTFSVPLTLTHTSADQTCRLRAVPHTSPPSDLTPFTGPRLAISEYATPAYESGPYAGRPYDFFFSANQLTGQADYRSLTDEGLENGEPLTSTLTAGGNVLYGNDSYNLGTDSAHSDLEVDGANAYGADAVEGICGDSCSASGVPAMTVSHNYGPSGNLVIHESEGLVRCAPDDATYPPTSCTSFVPTGVTVDRTIAQVNGDQSFVIDTYVSTNEAAHRLSLDSIEDGQEDAGYDFPWVDGSTYKTHGVGDSEPAPPTAPATVFLNHDNSQYDGDTDGAQAAITFGSRPTGFSYVDGYSGNTHLLAKLSGTVPAGGSTTLTQVFSWGFTKAVVQRLAAQAQASLHGPAVAFTAPANGATETRSPVTVSGTASASAGYGGFSSLKVDGKSVSVASNGTWSTTVGLKPGSNTWSAVVTDGDGHQSSATRTVSFVPSARIKKGKVTWKSGTVRVPLTCVAGGAKCSGKIQLTARESKFKGHGRKRRKHVVTVKVGSSSYAISAGKKKTVKVKLNGLGKRLLKAHRRLKVSGMVGLKGANGKSHTAARFSVAAKQAKAKKKKH